MVEDISISILRENGRTRSIATTLKIPLSKFPGAPSEVCLGEVLMKYLIASVESASERASYSDSETSRTQCYTLSTYLSTSVAYQLSVSLTTNSQRAWLWPRSHPFVHSQISDRNIQHSPSTYLVYSITY